MLLKICRLFQPIVIVVILMKICHARLHLNFNSQSKIHCRKQSVVSWKRFIIRNRMIQQMQDTSFLTVGGQQLTSKAQQLFPVIFLSNQLSRFLSQQTIDLTFLWFGSEMMRQSSYTTLNLHENIMHSLGSPGGTSFLPARFFVLLEEHLRLHPGDSNTFSS